MWMYIFYTDQAQIYSTVGVLSDKGLIEERGE
jgi:hypothetical protein